MGRTYRRNPYARSLTKPQYRGRKMKDKRQQRLQELMSEDAEIICFRCRDLYEACTCEQEKRTKEYEATKED